jgi:hypothetical protein
MALSRWEPLGSVALSAINFHPVMVAQPIRKTGAAYLSCMLKAFEFC